MPRRYAEFPLSHIFKCYSDFGVPCSLPSAGECGTANDISLFMAFSLISFLPKGWPLHGLVSYRVPSGAQDSPLKAQCTTGYFGKYFSPRLSRHSTTEDYARLELAARFYYTPKAECQAAFKDRWRSILRHASATPGMPRRPQHWLPITWPSAEFLISMEILLASIIPPSSIFSYFPPFCPCRS